MVILYIEHIQRVANSIRQLNWQELEAISAEIAKYSGIRRGYSKGLAKGLADWADDKYEEKNDDRS